MIRRGRAKVVVNYMEKYRPREVMVTTAEAQAILDTNSVIFLVEQGTIEIPSFDGQKRQVCTIRLERIITPKDNAVGQTPSE